MTPMEEKAYEAAESARAAFPFLPPANIFAPAAWFSPQESERYNALAFLRAWVEAEMASAAAVCGEHPQPTDLRTWRYR